MCTHMHTHKHMLELARRGSKNEVKCLSSYKWISEVRYYNILHLHAFENRRNSLVDHNEYPENMK